MSRVVVWPHKKHSGWESGNPPKDKFGNEPRRFPVVELRAALVERWPSDAHFTPYRIDGIDVCPRINGGGLVELMKTGRDVVYDAIVIDVDAPKNDVAREPIAGVGDASKWPARPTWQAGELVKLRDGDAELWSTVGWYLTRGGLRFVWELELGTPRAVYLQRLAELRAKLNTLGIVPDELVDFNRCYRLPFVTRDGVEQRLAADFSRLGRLPALPEVVGVSAEDFAGVDNARIGPFVLPETIADGARGRTLASYGAQLRHKGYGVDMIVSALMLANAARCKPPMPQDRIERIAKGVARYDPDPTASIREGLDEIVIRKGALPELVGRSEELLRDAGETFQRSGELVSIRTDELGSSIRPLDRHGLRVELGALAAWVQPKKATKAHEEETGEEWIFTPADVPLEVVDGLRGARAWSLPTLKELVEAPTLREDGTVIDVPGYDEKSGVFFASPNGTQWPTVADAPTMLDTLSALAALREIFVDFPFADRAAESVALAALLTAVGRPAIDGATPLFVFDSTTPGSGKSLMAHAITALVTDHGAGVMTQTGDEEAEKRITALLLSGKRVILLDNVEKALGGAAIDAAITAISWLGRRLGQSEMIQAPNRSVWIATGNNVQIRGDLARRCLRSAMAPEDERPEERTGFRHPDLISWVKRERPRLVAAALTLLRAYIAAGKPATPKVPFGSFDAWSELIRGAVVWLGLPDPCDSRAAIRELADPTADAMRSLLCAWRDLFGEQSKTVRDLLDVIEHQAFGGSGGSASSNSAERAKAALVELAGDRSGRIDARRAGWIFRKMNGRILESLKLEREDRNSNSGSLWRVLRVNQ